MKDKIKILVIVIAAGLLTMLIILKLRPMLAFKLAAMKALKVYPKAIVENCEKIYRLETNHFKSGQFKGTYSPGMEKFSDKFPYGWTTINKILWSKNPEFKPIGLKTFTENGTGKQKTFLQFRNIEGGVFTLCAFLQYFGNNAGRWFSLDADLQAQYNAKLENIQTPLTNEVA
jgi:hypothetical protein